VSFTLLISTDELAGLLGQPGVVVVDSRFALDDPPKGRQDYLAGHIPGAIYANLDEDLCGPIVPGVTGRHPLPVMEEFVGKVADWGIDNQTQVVVYDDAGGMYAGRLWWMMRWLGHERVALLDGDWRKWVREGRPVAAGEETNAPTNFVPAPQPGLAASVDEVLAALEDDHVVIADSRDEPRYMGEASGLDPVAGHIPGAISAWFGHNLNEDGTWRTSEELHERFVEILGDPDGETMPEEVIFYCGSGVSGVHNIIALARAGLGDARLYPGSWSHWIADPDRPIE
jgi:thiosulfate/3-mercaptopyruvate sulfurtransferase